MHGVQPSANASPIRYAPDKPAGLATSKRFSRINSEIGVRPKKCRPMTMMIKPATMASSPE